MNYDTFRANKIMETIDNVQRNLVCASRSNDVVGRLSFVVAVERNFGDAYMSTYAALHQMIYHEDGKKRRPRSNIFFHYVENAKGRCVEGFSTTEETREYFLRALNSCIRYNRIALAEHLQGSERLIGSSTEHAELMRPRLVAEIRNLKIGTLNRKKISVAEQTAAAATGTTRRDDSAIMLAAGIHLLHCITNDDRNTTRLENGWTRDHVIAGRLPAANAKRAAGYAVEGHVHKRARGAPGRSGTKRRREDEAGPSTAVDAKRPK